jgi:hypothetical protein
MDSGPFAEHTEHPSHLVERLTADVLDAAQHLRCFIGVGVDDLLGGSGLYDDDAHSVRHDVVHLAGDPAAFAGERSLCSGDAVGFGLIGALFGVGENPLSTTDEHPNHGHTDQPGAHARCTAEVVAVGCVENADARNRKQPRACHQDRDPRSHALLAVRGDGVERGQPEEHQKLTAVAEVENREHGRHDGEDRDRQVTPKQQAGCSDHDRDVRERVGTFANEPHIGRGRLNHGDDSDQRGKQRVGTQVRVVQPHPDRAQRWRWLPVHPSTVVC